MHNNVSEGLAAVLQQHGVRISVDHHAEIAIALGRGHNNLFQVIGE